MLTWFLVFCGVSVRFPPLAPQGRDRELLWRTILPLLAMLFHHVFASEQRGLEASTPQGCLSEHQAKHPSSGSVCCIAVTAAGNQACFLLNNHFQSWGSWPGVVINSAWQGKPLLSVLVEPEKSCYTSLLTFYMQNRIWAGNSPVSFSLAAWNTQLSCWLGKLLSQDILEWGLSKCSFTIRTIVFYCAAAATTVTSAKIITFAGGMFPGRGWLLIQPIPPIHT